MHRMYVFVGQHAPCAPQGMVHTYNRPAAKKAAAAAEATPNAACTAVTLTGVSAVLGCTRKMKHRHDMRYPCVHLSSTP